MDRIVLASNNKGKLAELQAMFAPLGATLVRQGELGIPEADEPHPTFVENALAKARNAAQLRLELPAIADDARSAARLDALRRPARAWTLRSTPRSSATPSGDDNNVKALLEQMKDVPNRRGGPSSARWWLCARPSIPSR